MVLSCCVCVCVCVWLACSSFPHGKRAAVLLAILLTIGGFVLSCYMGNEFAIAIGFMVLLLALMTTCMKVPAMALNLAAVAALGNAGSHVTAAYDLYKLRKNIMGVETLCSTFATVINGDDDMFGAYYREYQKYCSNDLYTWHAGTGVVWICCGVVLFLVPTRRGGATKQDVDCHPEEPTTSYQNKCAIDWDRSDESSSIYQL